MWMPVIVLAMAGGGCGSSVPDESGSLQSRPMMSTSQVEKASASDLLLVGETTIVERNTEGNVNEAASVNPTENNKSLSIQAIPFSIVKDLHSLDARDRYRALDHWETKGSQAALDHVFEALEDEDEAVRAKAEAIVEQRWEAEQEKERS